MSNIVVIQKVVANYRVGFFDLLSEKTDYTLISSNKNSGKIKAPKDLKLKKYAYFPFTIKLSDYVLIFPFLFFSLIKLRPQTIIIEGKQNTYNNEAICFFKEFGFNKSIISLKNTIDIRKGINNKCRNRIFI